MVWKDGGGETSIRKNALELVPLTTATASSKEDDNDEALRTTTTNSEEHYYSSNQKTHSTWQRLGVAAGAAILLVLLLVVMGTGATWFFLGTSRTFTGRTSQAASAATVEHPASKAPTVAFCGNSMLYYNDCPRLVEIMLQEMYSSEAPLQESCLRGGANLASLWEEGNGMQSRFTSLHNNTNIGAPTVSWLLQHPPSCENDNAHSSWDFIVLQDSELLVTNDQERPISMQALGEHYLPAISPSTIVLFLQTFSYESPRMRETIHLGDMPAMTQAIERGNQVYAQLARSDFGIQSQSIPMATAVQKLAQSTKTNENDLWELIYHHDGVHPSPYGTFLQACLIVSVLTGRPPPLLGDIQGKWQSHARHWATASNRYTESALPSRKEAQTLREWACQIVFLTSCPQSNNDTVNY